MPNFNDLTKIIESGIKIEVDDKNQVIKILKGVCIKDSKPEIIFDEIKVSFDEIKELQKNWHYSKALYSSTKRGIILIDIVGYSKYDNRYQAACLNLLSTAITYSLQRIYRSNVNVKKVFENIISTGDGYYIIFNEDLNHTFFRIAIYFISEMYSVQKKILENHAKNISQCDMVQIRVGCTLNDVDFFKDVMGGNNCYGIGLNDAARILSCVQDEIMQNRIKDTSLIFFDETVFEQATSFIIVLKKVFPSIIAEAIEVGSKEDKHGKKHRIWWVKDLPQQIPFDLFSIDNI